MVNEWKVGKYDHRGLIKYGPYTKNENTEIYAIGKFDKNKSFKTKIVNLKDNYSEVGSEGVIKVDLEFNSKEIKDYATKKVQDVMNQ